MIHIIIMKNTVSQEFIISLIEIIALPKLLLFTSSVWLSQGAIRKGCGGAWGDAD
ncbi:hypothetical protein V8J88_12545 [Massilia sp. W12]|uniref:hypothetical protein n=1 Tax=Massilia sp. W12 TaxID=3126507 RepID=UPI0030CD0C8A